MQKLFRSKLLNIVGLFLGLVSSSCMHAYRKSVGADRVIPVYRIFLTDFNTAWQAVLDSVKSNRLDVSNREGGYIQTRWTENTAEKNFSDSFGSSNAYLKAQFRFKITAAKGYYNGVQSVKIAVQKEQMVQRDVLEGWRNIETDTIDENTLLYRIGRLIYMRMKLAELEALRIKKEMRDAEANHSTSLDSGSGESGTSPEPVPMPNEGSVEDTSGPGPIPVSPENPE